MAENTVTMTIKLDSSELEHLGKRFNVLERLRSLEIDVGRLEREKQALEERVAKLESPQGL